MSLVRKDAKSAGQLPPARRQQYFSLQQVLDTFTQSSSFSLILAGAGHPYFNDP